MENSSNSHNSGANGEQKVALITGITGQVSTKVVFTLFSLMIHIIITDRYDDRNDVALLRLAF